MVFVASPIRVKMCITTWHLVCICLNIITKKDFEFEHEFEHTVGTSRDKHYIVINMGELLQ